LVTPRSGAVSSRAQRTAPPGDVTALVGNMLRRSTATAQGAQYASINLDRKAQYNDDLNMKKSSAVVGSAFFFVVAPCVVAGIVPWWITRWRFQPALFDLEATRGIGAALIILGLPGLVDSFARFALQGLGTPAPVAPTQKLVISGLYRYMRNPIYVA